MWNDTKNIVKFKRIYKAIKRDVVLKSGIAKKSFITVAGAVWRETVTYGSEDDWSEKINDYKWSS
mgnify:CR=1 FL=1